MNLLEKTLKESKWKNKKIRNENDKLDREPVHNSCKTGTLNGKPVSVQFMKIIETPIVQ